VTGKSLEVQEHFHRKGWTDGLPIIPPTEEKWAENAQRHKHRPDRWLPPPMWPEKWGGYVEKVAINGVMAGCKPEYMPVLLATFRLFLSLITIPRFDLEFLFLHADGQTARFANRLE